MKAEWQREVERHMLTEDVEKLRGQLKKARTDLSMKRGQIKRLQALANYILAAMSEEDNDSDPAIDKAFNKCERAGDLG